MKYHLWRSILVRNLKPTHTHHSKYHEPLIPLLEQCHHLVLYHHKNNEKLIEYADHVDQYKEDHNK